MSELKDITLLRIELWLKTLGIDNFEPMVSQSTKWIRCYTAFGPRTCRFCAKQNGKIYDKNYPPKMLMLTHINCKCFLIKLLSILAETVTIEGDYGADYWVKNFKVLPSNYVGKEKAKSEDWKSFKGNLRKIIPEATIGGDIFSNKEDKLPQILGRVWYEADINYTGGYRNTQRLLYSNDGLIFVTYDHYSTFYEII